MECREKFLTSTDRMEFNYYLEKKANDYFSTLPLEILDHIGAYLLKDPKDLLNLFQVSKGSSKLEEKMRGRLYTTKIFKEVVSQTESLPSLLKQKKEVDAWYVVLKFFKRNAQPWSFDPSSYKNNAIFQASSKGCLKVVKELLKDERVDPADNYNRPIRWASTEGHLEVVKELLKDSRVDPTAIDNEAIRMASKYGHLEVVKELLKDERVDPSACEQEALRSAKSRGHFKITQELSKDVRVSSMF